MTTFWMIFIPLEAPAVLLCGAGSWHMLHAHKSDAARRAGRLLLFLGVGWLILTLGLQALFVHHH